ncbi:hypothetical protein [Pseudomonas sp. TWP3-2]|uniref:hypothetical protein n=1 Tax=Pseudomonas sp. TWP3-2 TaxID=2804574 RepID=UPI003CE88435
MNTPTSPQNTILVLAPPSVQGATIPVIGAHIGVPLAIYNLVPDGLGARVRIDPPRAGTVDPTDTIVLMLKGESAPLDSKPVGNPNAPIEMRIPVGRLNHARVNELYYDIIRNSQNVGSSTPMLEALFNMIRPGLKDVRPDIVGHSELGMTLPDEIKDGVGPGIVSAQVCFTYPYGRAYDTITLKCNGEAFVQTCIKAAPDSAKLLEIINQAKAGKHCGVAQRLYANRAQAGDALIANAYAREYDPKYLKASECFPTADNATAAYWYETILTQDPNNAEAKQRFEELQK